MQITDSMRFKTSAFLIKNGIPFNAVMSMGDDQRLGWAIAFHDLAETGLEWPEEEQGAATVPASGSQAVDGQLIDGRPDNGDHMTLGDAMKAKVAELEEVVQHMAPGRGSASIRWSGEAGGFTYTMTFGFAETPR